MTFDLDRFLAEVLNEAKAKAKATSLENISLHDEAFTKEVLGLIRKYYPDALKLEDTNMTVNAHVAATLSDIWCGVASHYVAFLYEYGDVKGAAQGAQMTVKCALSGLRSMLLVHIATRWFEAQTKSTNSNPKSPWSM